MNLTAESQERIDKYLTEKLDYSRSKITRMISTNNILVNDKPTKNSYKLHIGDNISINEDYTEEVDIKEENIPLDIHYEDEYLIVVNKKSGIVVHPAPGNYEKTLVNALMYHCNNLSTINGSIRPGIVHRIDADTSGLLLVAKNDEVHNDLAEQIKNKTVKRVYIALVHGVIKEDTATIDAPIGRDPNNRKKMTVTDINAKDAITQIRVHLNYTGHPIVNDPVYGNKKLVDKSFGQMLHAKTIGFVHPITKKYLEFTSLVPEEFNKILDIYKTNS